MLEPVGRIKNNGIYSDGGRGFVTFGEADFAAYLAFILKARGNKGIDELPFVVFFAGFVSRVAEGQVGKGFAVHGDEALRQNGILAFVGIKAFFCG